eukprot:jgi/Orpsp1_1/1175147/evm.model.c7180000052781.1
MKIYNNNRFDKNSPEAGTCYNTNYNSFFEGINYQTKDTYFFAFIIQFILVALMYYHVGSGRYWKVLYWSAISGLIAAVIEHSSIAYICQKSEINKHYAMVTFLIEEFFWIICEYSIPYLNLIKMETVSQNENSKVIKYLIFMLFIPFSIIRVYNGYDRMISGVLYTDKSRTTHGLAFGVMAVADIICTISIFYFVKYSDVEDSLKNINLFSSIKKSNLTILVAVDIVSLILSILYIISTLMPNNTKLNSSTTLFHCLKSVFILILTTDALIFKYEVNNESIICLSTSSFASSIDLKRVSTINDYSIEITSSNFETEKVNNVISRPSISHEKKNSSILEKDSNSSSTKFINYDYI